MKFRLNKDDWFGIYMTLILLIFLASLIVGAILVSNKESQNREIACNEIGYDFYVNLGDGKYCTNNNVEFYRIRLDINNKFIDTYKATEIKLYDYRSEEIR